VSRLSRPVHPILCYVTDRLSLPGSSLRAAVPAKMRQAGAAGVDWIQIREKDLPGGEIASLTCSAVAAVQQTETTADSCKVLVNDRLDVALAEKAGGVHLGEKSVQVRDARKLVADACPLLQESFLIGASCHSLEAAVIAARGGADYIFFGPVFATPSKAAFGPAQGLAQLAQVCWTVSIPVLAIGGINLENAGLCLASGAAGVAAIRLFQEAKDLRTLVASLHALPLK